MVDFDSEMWTGAGGTCRTLNNLYKLLGEVVASQEEDLNTEITELASQGASVDQGKLLKVQGMVQSWGVVSGLATGTLRAAGDALTKTTQNIR
jgi:hypothetical protein